MRRRNSIGKPWRSTRDRKALEIYTRLAQKNPGAYEPDLATISVNLAILLADIGHQEDAELLLHKALEICERYPHLAEMAKQIHSALESNS